MLHFVGHNNRGHVRSSPTCLHAHTHTHTHTHTQRERERERERPNVARACGCRYSVSLCRQHQCSELFHKVASSSGVGFKIVLAAGCWVMVIPTALGLLFELLIVIPLRVPIDETPCHYFYQVSVWWVARNAPNGSIWYHLICTTNTGLGTWLDISQVVDTSCAVWAT